MRKTKTQKGITLVALIITIVVLLILAVVAITAIQDEDLIGKANSAVTTYNQSVVNEGTQLGNYANFIGGYLTGGTTGDDTTGGGTTTYAIGDEVIVMNGEDEERFCVIGETSTTVLLLPKFTVDSSTAKQNAEGYGFDVLEEENIEGVLSRLNSASSAYGSQLGGTGRPMTKEEADYLYELPAGQEILKGYNTEWSGAWGFYLGTPGEPEGNSWAIYVVVATTGRNRTSEPYHREVYNFRPVVEISKDKVTPVTPVSE